LQRADTQRQFGIAADKAGKIGAGFVLDAVLGKHCGQRFAPAGGFGEQQYATAKTGEMAFQRTERVVAAAVDRKIGQFWPELPVDRRILLH